jgi:hypothetical protein
MDTSAIYFKNSLAETDGKEPLVDNPRTIS